MVLSINGKRYLFESSNLHSEDTEAIKIISRLCTQKCLKENIKSEEMIKDIFINEVSLNLGIQLFQVEISFVVSVDGILS